MAMSSLLLHYLLIFGSISLSYCVVFQFQQETTDIKMHEITSLMELLMHIYIRDANLRGPPVFFPSVALSKPTTVHSCCLWVKLVPKETFSKGRWLVFCH